MSADKKNTGKSSLLAIKDKFSASQSEVANWMKTNSLSFADVREFSQKMLVALSLVGQISFAEPAEAKMTELANLTQENENLRKVSEEEKQEIINKMIAYVNLPPGHLEKQEELYLEQQLSDLLQFNVTASLDEHRLNHSIGIMGGEQHLIRYPGDTLAKHDAYLEAGIAPGRGAFGWFTENGELTANSVMMEKYYFAVQTLYLPDWNTNHKELKPWYKFRKMIAVNPNEGLAVVGVVGDAGPALWVKKQFGGSPEVIREAKIWSAKTRGKVILYFVDDPNDEVALGVYDLNTGEYLSNNLVEEGS